MCELNDTAKNVLRLLRWHAENKHAGWGDVYLDNAAFDSGLRPTVFRAALSTLAKAGLYKAVDGDAWGDVKLAD